MTDWNRIAAPVLDLFRRIKRIERDDGTWPGGDVVDTVTAWIGEHGLDPCTPADEPAHLYRHTVTVETSSHLALDEDDLHWAIRAAIIGTGVRVELADSADTVWVELDCAKVHTTPA